MPTRYRLASRRQADSPVSAFQSLASGRWEALLNVAENAWFEAKQDMYELADARQRFEFALDVTSLADANHGGLIVTGFETHRDTHGRDVASNVGGLSRAAVSVTCLEDITHHLVHPSPRALSIAVFRSDGRDVLAILIPPQSAEPQPFLITGTAVDSDKLYGRGFTWVERQSGSKQAVSTSDVQRLLRSALSESARAEAGAD